MNIFKQIKWFIQRGKRGYADCDIWGFDSYLNTIILAGLKHLAKTSHSYPASLKDLKSWQHILDEMIDGFEAYQVLNQNSFMYIVNGKKEINEEQMLVLDEKFRKALKLFTEYYGCLWG